MGLTLIAILTAAMLLPGIVAVRAFYQAGSTKEVEPALPTLSSAGGIGLIGGFSAFVHLFYVLALKVATMCPAWTNLPLANPYALLIPSDLVHDSLTVAWSLFLGLFWLLVIAVLAGFLVGKAVYKFGDHSLFYGALAEVISAGEGDDRFVIAYVLSKVANDHRLIGYCGTVVSLLRDEQRFPAKIVLKDAAVFYLDIDGDMPVRKEQAESIDWIALHADEWHNVAFRVFEVVDDQVVTDSSDQDRAGGRRQTAFDGDHGYRIFNTRRISRLASLHAALPGTTSSTWPVSGDGVEICAVA